jgi:ABC-type sugar transport system substrate-binding protein
MRSICAVTLLSALVGTMPVSRPALASNTHASITVGYLVKTLVNPYFVAMEPVAKAEA